MAVCYEHCCCLGDCRHAFGTLVALDTPEACVLQRLRSELLARPAGPSDVMLSQGKLRLHAFEGVPNSASATC